MAESVTQTIGTLGAEIYGVLARNVRSRLLEVSRSGCLLESGHRVETGTIGELRLHVGNELLTDDVRVTRCVRVEGSGSSYLVGAEFLQTRQPTEHSIRRAVTGILRGVAQLETAPARLVKTHRKQATETSVANVNATPTGESVMTDLLARFVREEEGQDLIEYGLLAGLITTAVVAAITAIGTRVLQLFTNLQTAITPAP
jgi:pilus assembly protein Flp/PilA